MADLNQQLADRPPVPMNEQQGNADAQELLQNGTLSPDAQARLTAATALSPDQQAALERGDLVLPRSTSSARSPEDWTVRPPTSSATSR